MHIYLIGLTTLMSGLVEIWNSLKTSDCPDCLLSSRRFSWSPCRVQGPFRLIPISDKIHLMQYVMPCNVWLCMNETSEYLDSFFIRTYLFFFLGFTVLLCPCAFTNLSFWLVLLLFCLVLWKDIFVLMLSRYITTFLYSELSIVIPWFFHHRENN